MLYSIFLPQALKSGNARANTNTRQTPTIILGLAFFRIEKPPAMNFTYSTGQHYLLISPPYYFSAEDQSGGLAWGQLARIVLASSEDSDFLGCQAYFGGITLGCFADRSPLIAKHCEGCKPTFSISTRNAAS
jgi:hypothetical protein